MLGEIKRLLAELHGGAKSSSRFEPDDYRVAAAALLVRVFDGMIASASEDTGDEAEEELEPGGRP